MNYQLHVYIDGQETQVYDVAKSPIYVGRDSGLDIVIDDPEVSRRHAGFSFKNKRCNVKNFDATNGLRLNGNTLFTVIAGEGDLSPRERAHKMATQIEQLFAANLTYNDVRKSADKTAVLMKGIPVIRVLPEDAVVMGSAEAVADKAYKEIMRALIKEQIDRPF